MTKPDHEVVVIGAGPGGLCAGVRLLRAGISDFVIVERAADIGGTWRDNTYPGIGVDIPSFAYQFSFARNPNWSRLFPKGDEIKAYHDDVADRFGLRSHILLNTEIVREAWDDDEHLWRLDTADGRTITARFVISAIGAFLRPKRNPGIDGLDRFAGKVQEPCRWDHGYDHHGKRVAVIGTGASSVQIAPALAPEVAHLDVYQRTPVWCMPKPDHRVPAHVQRLLGIRGVGAAIHGLALAGVEVGLGLMVYTPPALADPGMRAFDRAARHAYARYVRAQVKDPATSDALIPRYGPLGKRPTISNEFLQVFNRANTDLVTTPIDTLTETGIRTTDGVEREIDMLVLATGYELFSDAESYRPGTIIGRDGFDLGAFFSAHRLQAYESVSLPKLPNRWMVVGPYSWSGTGWHALVEITTRHAVRAIAEARRRGATAIEVRADAHQAYHDRVRRRGRNMAHYLTVQNRGLRTYYVNSQGDTPYIRPSTALQARAHSMRFPLEDYEYSRPSARAAASGARDTVQRAA